MEPFDVTFAPEGSAEYEYTIVPSSDQRFLIFLEGEQVCAIKLSDEHVPTWEACEGSLTDEELQFITDKIESRYL